jgi:hypothetical protein
MPLFSSSRRPTADTNGSTPDTRATSSSPDGERKGLFSTNRRASTSSSNRSSKRLNRSGTGLFGNRRRNQSRTIDHDPSIINARQKVSEAENAEKDADRALMEARKHVKLAREHVRTLEHEASEE